MTEILTSAQMRSIEGAAIESGAVSGLALMERAGAGVVAEIFATWPELAQSAGSALVLCGPGNNGGDGYVIARHLAERGWQITLAALAPPAARAADACASRDAALQAGCEIQPLTRALITGCAQAPAPRLVIDALFGTGLMRGLSAELQQLCQELDAADRSSQLVVAVDIPSGLCADTGQILSGPQGGYALPADLTVTFHRRKHGHVLGEGPRLCGELRVVDIGLAPWHEMQDAR